MNPITFLAVQGVGQGADFRYKYSLYLQQSLSDFFQSCIVLIGMPNLRCISISFMRILYRMSLFIKLKLTIIGIHYHMTKKYKAFKYRLEPTQEQAELMTQWFVSILSEVDVVIKPITEAIGIDVGVKRFATMSDGTFIEPINFDQEVTKLHKHQITMARRKKGSARWLKAKTRVQKAYTRITNKRKDFIHKATTKLSTARLVSVEDLKIGNISASAAGTVESPGKMVSQKRWLNRAILTQWWGLFFEMLKYKVEDNGGMLVKVPPQHSSQECNECGHKANADDNAASVILARGLRVTARNQGGK